MLALKSYEQNEGFSTINADELFFINGGSGTTSQSSGNQTSVSNSKGGCACNPCNCGDTYVTIYGNGNQTVVGNDNSNISNNNSTGINF